MTEGVRESHNYPKASESLNASLKRERADFNASVRAEGWGAEVLSGAQSGVCERGAEFLKNKEDMLLALCLNNGYYNRENIYRMLKFALAFSRRVQVFTTDGPTRHNYRALRPDMDTIGVERKIRLEKHGLQNKIKDALKRINIALPADAQRSVIFLEWQPIYADTQYQKDHVLLQELYDNNSDFRRDIESATRYVLSNRKGMKGDMEQALNEGVHYVLEELAFIRAYSRLGAEAKPVADHGAKVFNYIYYESWPVFEKLMNGGYGSESSTEVGYVIVKMISNEI